MKAVLTRINISPKKANLVAGTVRGKKVTEALSLLKFMPKKGADILYKVVHSAAYNAKNNFKQSLDDLIITQILVTKGPTYKRSQPISRGRAHPIRKRTCHITVQVGMPGVDSSKLAPVEKKKVEEKAVKADSKEKKEVKAKAKPKVKKEVKPKVESKVATKSEKSKKTTKKTNTEEGK
ncbi:50S ribosomal protein L22 [Candidatus Peregrinibacteria bacterium]|nr:50S ribosomal protein L22 [Candidatus Peregrinibacteria bacterium]